MIDVRGEELEMTNEEWGIKCEMKNEKSVASIDK